MDFNMTEKVDLDSKFFDSDNHLRSEVRSVLMDVFSDLADNLAKEEIDFPNKGVVMTGSLLGPNWDGASDIDFHVIMDFSDFQDPKMAKKFFQYFAKAFNTYKYDLLGRNLEVYFQDINEPHVSPGVYDVVNDKWIEEPKEEVIEITKEMKDKATEYLEQISELGSEYGQVPREHEAIREFLHKVKDFFRGIRDMRKESIKKDGEASVGNQVFKLLRRNNGLQRLTDLIRQVQDDYYEVWYKSECVNCTMADEILNILGG